MMICLTIQYVYFLPQAFFWHSGLQNTTLKKFGLTFLFAVKNNNFLIEAHQVEIFEFIHHNELDLTLILSNVLKYILQDKKGRYEYTE